MFLNGFEISIIIKTQKKSFFKSKFDSEMEHQLRHETQVGIPPFTVFENHRKSLIQYCERDELSFIFGLDKIH